MNVGGHLSMESVKTHKDLTLSLHEIPLCDPKTHQEAELDEPLREESSKSARAEFVQLQGKGEKQPGSCESIFILRPTREPKGLSLTAFTGQSITDISSGSPHVDISQPPKFNYKLISYS